MKKYFLSIMKGQRRDFPARLIIYILLPFSLIYRLGVFCHRTYHFLKGPFKAPKPVISIGNITVGGSGKTPLVIWLARQLQDKGFKSAILTRGYMPKVANLSDEADMLNEQIPYIPVLVGPNRVDSIKKSTGHIPVDVYICDDAFQHWPLARDLNIVTIDAGNPFGNRFLLPAGILREGISALKRADVIVLTKADASSKIDELCFKLKWINPDVLIMESQYQSKGAIDVFDTRALPERFLNDRQVVGFCAIGDPLSFELTLKNSGAKVAKMFTYMDHHFYKKSEIVRMADFCRAQKVPVLVTTHKDAVKLQIFKSFFDGLQVVYIPIQLEVTKGCDEFLQKVLSICIN